MKKHVKIYLEHHAYTGHEFIPCEKCGATAVDIHHIESKGMGGNPDKDSIENLIALCRTCHEKAHNRCVGDIPADGSVD